jgi:hypothetical protein
MSIVRHSYGDSSTIYSSCRFGQNFLLWFLSHFWRHSKTLITAFTLHIRRISSHFKPDSPARILFLYYQTIIASFTRKSAFIALSGAFRRVRYFARLSFRQICAPEPFHHSTTTSTIRVCYCYCHRLAINALAFAYINTVSLSVPVASQQGDKNFV